MRRISPLVLRAAFAALLCALAAGCVGSGDIIALVPIAGGEKVRVPMSGKSLPMTKTAEVEIVRATFDIQEKEKTITYHFDFKLLAPNTTLRRVAVEDVASDQPILLVEDTNPQVEQGHWTGSSRPVPPGDSRAAWLITVENSIRIFRFTIETTDGRKFVLMQPLIVPAFMKSGIRQGLGLNY